MGKTRASTATCHKKMEYDHRPSACAARVSKIEGALAASAASAPVGGANA